MLNQLCKGCDHAKKVNGKWQCDAGDTEGCIREKTNNIPATKWIDAIDESDSRRMKIENFEDNGEKLTAITFKQWNQERKGFDYEWRSYTRRGKQKNDGRSLRWQE